MVPRRELSIRNKKGLKRESGPIDPALWNCVCLYELRLELADGALTSLPPQVSRLHDLTTLILSGNALASLPEEVGELRKLKNFEAAANGLTALPASFSKLEQLQVLDLSSNKLSDVSPLRELTELVGVNLGHNALTSLELAWPMLEHMQSLAAPHNAIVAMPPGIGVLPMLSTLDLASNAIEQVPIELGQLTVKKLLHVRLAGNPLKDPRIRRFIEDNSPTLVKDLLNHVRKNGYKGEEAAGGGKQGGKGGKKGKKGKGKPAKVESESGSEGGDDIAALLAAMAHSDSDGAVDAN